LLWLWTKLKDPQCYRLLVLEMKMFGMEEEEDCEDCECDDCEEEE